ncbi:MAG: MFS transporter [Alphaproteobacteria bacterium]|nr:MFS transporter [Alphaproteobacteria bacterium]
MTTASTFRAAGPLVAALGFCYIIGHFYRVSTGVIAPDLMRELALSAEAMGALNSAFFFGFAAAQLPIGVLLDRWGPRITVPLTMLLAVAGAAVFYAASSAIGLTIGRALMGIGTGGVLMGSLVVASRWFPGDRFAAVTSVFVATGTVGAVLATTPLATASALFGWRGAFALMAVITLAGLLMAYIVVRDAPPGHAYHGRQRETWGDAFRGLKEVLRNRRLPYIVAANAVAYPSALTIAGLWGAPYLTGIHGLTPVQSGNVLLVMTVGMIIGHLAYGRLDRVFDTRKGLIVFGSIASMATMVILAALPSPSVWQVVVLFTLLGAFTSYSTMITTHGRAIFPAHLVGRGMTTNNMSVFLGAAAFQWLSGVVIDAFTPVGGPPPVDAYRAMFAMTALILLISVLIYSRVDDVKPSQEAR